MALTLSTEQAATSENRLPPEIISYIARCVHQVDCGFGAGPIVALTHVCQYWRDCIVSAPDNWVQISNSQRELAELSLRRAKAAPLDVILIPSSRGESFDFLLPHACNIVSLDCTYHTTTEELVQTLSNFPKSMPNLQSLTLSGCERDADQYNHAIDPLDLSTHTMLRKLSCYDLPLFPSILGLSALTELNFRDLRIRLHVDTILEFLESNRSLERANFAVNFEEDSLCRSRRQTPVKTRLQHLFIWCNQERNVKPLISNIRLRKGGTLELMDYGDVGLSRILSTVSTTHLPGSSLEYQPFPRKIRLIGPDGTLLYRRIGGEHLSFPSLETLVVLGHDMNACPVGGEYTLDISIPGSSVALPLSPVLPDPAFSPLLETLAFLDCDITEDFMDNLARLALDRKNHTSTSLRRVIIMHSKGRFPSESSVRRLREYVPVVEVSGGNELPEDPS